MSQDLVTALVVALLAGAGGFGVPALIGRIPEPPSSADKEDEPAEEAEEPAKEPAEEPAKETYAHMAQLPGLGWRSAVASALIGLIVGWSTGLDPSLLWLTWLIPVSVALSVIDWRTRLLPRLVVLPATLLAIVVVVAVGLATGDSARMLQALVAMVLVRTFFWLLWAMHSAGMGFGDVRLAAIVGLVLGWVGWGALAVGVWTGFIVFALPGVLLAIVKRDRSLMRKPFPYGPFMLAGALVGLVWGPAVARQLWG